jgi:integrase
VRIERYGPEYLRNVVRVITETGLRINKELLPMRKEQVDLTNASVWIPDSKTPSGIADVPLTPIALDAFRSQVSLAGPGDCLFPSAKNAHGCPKIAEKSVAHNAEESPISGSTISVPPTQPGSVAVAWLMNG